MRTERANGAAKVNLVEVIRADIVRGRLRPGEKLSAAALAETHEASLTVVREALNRLAGEQLVNFEPQIGFSVRPVSYEDFVDLMDQRILLENVALRRCMATASVDWQAEVLASHHKLSCTPMIDPDDATELNPLWLERHDAFHSTVLQGCGSRRLYQAVLRLSHEAEVYYRALLPVSGRDDGMVAEHEKLVAAILGGDVDEAIALLTAHQEKTRDELLPLLALLEADA
ncbi:GntR family transcriptional regulator [Paraburkholderia sp.]|uniref:GntR family transcriptional regulator n=1 Tax=Paraburkholderia sp. TaxID=1926495 RepID=UPI0023A3F67F|nr:GntR family transcriptional regulator [Paraburkholderia sp.]MDE1180508.1 GntR family transcriptional regulator [Paraburkholderia sp.]